MRLFLRTVIPILVFGLLLFWLLGLERQTSRNIRLGITIVFCLLIIFFVIKAGGISKFYKEWQKQAHKTGVRRRALIKSAFLGKEPEYYINESIKKDKEKRKKKRVKKDGIDF